MAAGRGSMQAAGSLPPSANACPAVQQAEEHAGNGSFEMTAAGSP
jgi:hypothetical protein